MRFVITGLPRSRSAWFSAYFSQGNTLCYHEAGWHDNDMDNPKYTHVGTADSGYVLIPKWGESIGKHKIVTIHRNIEEVEVGLRNIGQTNTRQLLEDMVPLLNALPGLHINFEDIDARLKEIHDYLRVPGYEKNRHEVFAEMNIQSQNWRA